jgi:hypothetical protein
MKALQVWIDGREIGIYVPPKDGHFSAMLGNIPRTYMRAFVSAGNGSEGWQWQLPDLKEGETISFRMIDAKRRAGRRPQSKWKYSAEEIAERTRLAREGYARAMKERSEVEARKARTTLRASKREKK